MVLILLIINLQVTNLSYLDVVISLFIVGVLSIALFILQIWAAGDSKLLIIFAPLFLTSQLLDIIVAVLLYGGALSVFYWFKYKTLLNNKIDEGLPYGVAIVFGVNTSLYFSQGLPIYL